MAELTSLRFLVVDDMKTMRKIVGNQLKTAGCSNFTEVEDGKPAWDLLEKSHVEGKPIEFVVSDWNMPNLSGIELLKKCRADARFNKLPFLLVTAESEKEQVKEAILAGVDNYVVKPFTPDSFLAKLKAVYEKRFGKIEVKKSA